MAPAPDAPTRSGRRRVFFALVPPPRVRDDLARAGRALAWPGRAVVEDRLHLTLVFVGDATPPEVEALVALGGSVTCPRVALAVDRTGSFPRARVGWLGCTAPPDALLAFRAALFERLDAAGLHRDRRAWTPHVTVYRDLRSRPAKVPIKPLRWPVRDYALLVSEPVPGGVRYEALRRWDAAGPGDDREGA